ARQH
ncbi:hypothetical protein EE612_055638, partial [Oryza sativa]